MRKVIHLDPSNAWEWADFLKYIQGKVTPQQFVTWFSSLDPISRTEDELILGVDDPFTCEGITTRHQELLDEAAKHFYRRAVRVRVVPIKAHAERVIEPEPKPEPQGAVVVSAKPEVQEALQKDVEEACRVGYSSRLLVQATFPHSKPGPQEFYFERRNGFVTLKLIADPKYGLPYGTYPRLIMIWLVAEAVRTKSPVLHLGKSLRQFTAQLGLGYNGGAKGSGPRVLEHMQRLFTCTVSADMQRDGRMYNVGYRPVEKIAMFWNPNKPTYLDEWQSVIELNRSFFEEFIQQPVPLRMDAVQALALGKNASSMALDIYQWLTHRFSYLKAITHIPWEQLQLQFGGDYARPVDFKRKFAKQLKAVLEVYRDANVEVTTRGLLLRPSKTHVPMRLISGGRKKADRLP